MLTSTAQNLELRRLTELRSMLSTLLQIQRGLLMSATDQAPEYVHSIALMEPVEELFVFLDRTKSGSLEIVCVCC